jgi:hypothetical protein
MDRTDAERVAYALAALEGPWCDLRLIGRAARGESGGAFVVETTNEERWVLKWNEAPLAFREQQLVWIDRLRGSGYPIPRHIAVAINGGTAVLQRFLHGKVGAPVTADLAAELVGLVGLQAGKAGPGPTGWHDLVVGSLTVGLDGWCIHESLAGYSSRSRALLDRIRTAGRSAGSLPALDLVHLDLHTGNVISDCGRVVAVIDWDAIQPGDRTADLVKFAFTAMQTASDDVLGSLWDPILLDTNGTVEVYVAHVVLNLVDWQIRFHPELADVAIACGEKAFEWVDAGRFLGYRG